MRVEKILLTHLEKGKLHVFGKTKNKLYEIVHNAQTGEILYEDSFREIIFDAGIIIPSIVTSFSSYMNYNFINELYKSNADSNILSFIFVLGIGSIIGFSTASIGLYNLLSPKRKERLKKTEDFYQKLHYYKNK